MRPRRSKASTEAGGAGEVRHWNADVNGISLHVTEQGPAAGSAVLLLHGFPELLLSWHHQMAALAARGFQVLTPDLCGYGDSDAPADPVVYSIFHIVGDIVELLDHLGLPKVFVVGHDWGAPVAWHLCLFRPDRVHAVVNLGVPYFPRSPRPMTESFAALGDSFYIVQLQVVIFLAPAQSLESSDFCTHSSSCNRVLWHEYLNSKNKVQPMPIVGVSPHQQKKKSTVRRLLVRS